MRKILFLLVIIPYMGMSQTENDAEKKFFMENQFRNEYSLGKKGVDEAKKSFGFKSLLVLKNTLAIDVSHNFLKKSVFNIGIGYPVWLQKAENERIIFVPMIYKSFGSFKGLGVGFNANWEKDRFSLSSYHQLSIGKKGVDDFYGPNVTSFGWMLGEKRKWILGGEVEVMASTEELQPGQIQTDLRNETMFGPMLKFRQELAKKWHRIMAVETSYVWGNYGNRLLVSLIIE